MIQEGRHVWATLWICEQKQGRGYSVYTMKNEQDMHGYELS